MKIEQTSINQHYRPNDLVAYAEVEATIDALIRIYESSLTLIRADFERLVHNDLFSTQSKDACYPFLGFEVDAASLNTDATLSYGIVDAPGWYGTTITNPAFFRNYLREQLTLLQKNYGGPFYVGKSTHLIPWHFAHIKEPQQQLTPEQIRQFRLGFVHPDLLQIDDEVVNHTFDAKAFGYLPLALFDAQRVDFSLHRLHHYTSTNPEHFQNFIVLSNYQRYVDEFIKYGLECLKNDSGYMSLVLANDQEITRETADTFPIPPRHLSQMPAYHLKRPDQNGITFINIGVGPSNAKNITDHLAVLRPHCWLMLGHCAGLQRSQTLGDYVLAHGYVREDNVLDHDLPLWIPVPPIAEVQIALQEAVAHVTGLEGHQLKTRMRTGTVFTTDNRNWELRSREFHARFNQSRAIALDMESATVAANGLRLRVPFGTLLCVSDKPVHGEIKLRNMANAFYESRVQQHLKIGLQTIEILRDRGIQSLHSRKLRGFDEPSFR